MERTMNGGDVSKLGTQTTTTTAILSPSSSSSMKRPTVDHTPSSNNNNRSNKTMVVVPKPIVVVPSTTTTILQQGAHDSSHNDNDKPSKQSLRDEQQQQQPVVDIKVGGMTPVSTAIITSNINNTNHQRKRISPFRIKTGCIVACRINSNLLLESMMISVTTTTTTITKQSEQHGTSQVGLDNNNNNHAVATTTSCRPNQENNTTMSTTIVAENRSNGTEPVKTDSTTSSSITTTATSTINYCSSENTTESYHMIWTDPVRHRDLFWALIGKRIRCCIPHFLLQQQPVGVKENPTTPTTPTTFEGEVIRVYNHSTTNKNDSDQETVLNQPKQQQPQQVVDVELLVDVNLLLTFPFLQSMDPVHTSAVESGLSRKEQRNYELEQHVARGFQPNHHNNNKNNSSSIKQLVAVRVALQLVPHVTNTTVEDTTTLTNRGQINRVVPVVISKWLIQKCLPISLVNNKRKNTSNGSSQTRKRKRPDNGSNNNDDNNTLSKTGTKKAESQQQQQKQLHVAGDKDTNETTTNHNGSNSVHENITMGTTVPEELRSQQQQQQEQFGDNNNIRGTADETPHVVNRTTNGNAVYKNSKQSRCMGDTTVGDADVLSSGAVDGCYGDSSKREPPNNGTKSSTVDAGASLSSVDGCYGDSSKREPINNGTKNNKSRTTTTSNTKNNRQRYKSIVQYIGDGNDTAEQQIQNWRFLASRYHDVVLRSSIVPPLEYTTGVETSIASTAGTHNMDSQKTTQQLAELLSFGFIGEVIKVDASASPTETLAMVTIRRMYLPEHTAAGRSNMNQWNDVYMDYDSTTSLCNDIATDVLITLPIEQLVVVSRNVYKPNVDNDVSSTCEDATIQYSYSLASNTYYPNSVQGLSTDADSTSNRSRNMNNFLFCHRCRRSNSDRTNMTSCKTDDCQLRKKISINIDVSTPIVVWCKECIYAIDGRNKSNASSVLPCCDNTCDCDICITNRENDSEHRLFSKILKRTKKLCSRTRGDDVHSKDVLSFGASMLQSLQRSCAFYLPDNYCFSRSTLPIPQIKPKTRILQRTIRTVKSNNKPSTLAARVGTKKDTKTILVGKTKARKRTNPDSEVASVGHELSMAPKKKPLLLKRNHCAREIVYKESKKYSFKSWMTDGRDASVMPLEKPRCIRTLQEPSTRLITEQKDDAAKASNSNRAARASQRRLLKDVASLSVTAPSFLGLVDTLASREPQLRFDRSKIHAWGVFADTALLSGEMIVEYRGELIGNAVAELREKEYEVAKIGSDYMFRIDSLTVCDATKQGNVARFINASCDPNCYTKIISFDGLKRIVIYAKKDIQAGDELCYDYKFPIEYDETKRIPCRCGARECRGYMNWDKKYVALSRDGNGAQPPSTTADCKPIKNVSEEG